MINFYIDLDDTIFDFANDFLQFANERLGRKYEMPEVIEDWKPECFFGINPKMMEYLLGQYSEAGKFGIQPLMPGAKEGLEFIHFDLEGIAATTPHFITIREPESFIQTLSRLQDLHSDLGFVYPSDTFHVHFANNKYQKKWKIIKELSRFVKEGIFIDDNPMYINDIVEKCPGVLTIWIDSFNMNGDLGRPHYKVKNWEEIIKLLKENTFEELWENSGCSGIQAEIT